MNNLLRKYLDKVGTTYPFVVTDNEAGMEHLSRRTTNNIDLLMIVSEPTIVGAMTMQRIIQLADSLPITLRKKICVMNRVPRNGIHENVQQKLDSLGIEISAILPFDEEVYNAAASGESVFEVSRENELYTKLRSFCKSIYLQVCLKRQWAIVDKGEWGTFIVYVLIEVYGNFFNE